MGDWTTIVDRAELVSFVAAAWLRYEEPPPSPPPAAPVAEEMGSTPPAGICGQVCGQLGTRGAGVQVRVTPYWVWAQVCQLLCRRQHMETSEE